MGVVATIKIGLRKAIKGLYFAGGQGSMIPAHMPKMLEKAFSDLQIPTRPFQKFSTFHLTIAIKSYALTKMVNK